MAVGTAGFAATYRTAVGVAAIIPTTGSDCSCSTDGSCFSAGCCCYHFGCCACSRMPIVVAEVVAERPVPRRSLNMRGLEGRHILAC